MIVLLRMKSILSVQTFIRFVRKATNVLILDVLTIVQKTLIQDTQQVLNLEHQMVNIAWAENLELDVQSNGDVGENRRTKYLPLVPKRVALFDTEEENCEDGAID